jgi:hypothetical protein
MSCSELPLIPTLLADFDLTKVEKVRTEFRKYPATVEGGQNSLAGRRGEAAQSAALKAESVAGRLELVPVDQDDDGMFNSVGIE